MTSSPPYKFKADEMNAPLRAWGRPSSKIPSKNSAPVACRLVHTLGPGGSQTTWTHNTMQMSAPCGPCASYQSWGRFIDQAVSIQFIVHNLLFYQKRNMILFQHVWWATQSFCRSGGSGRFQAHLTGTTFMLYISIIPFVLGRSKSPGVLFELQ